MWIWIGWGLCGILAFAIMWRGWGICFNGRYQVAKLIESVGCFVLGPIGEIVALVMVGKYCFRKKEHQFPYIFKCSVCGLEITKTEKELSAIEKEALKKLKLL